MAAEKQTRPVAASDADTVAYFDSHVPDYDPSRMEHVAAFIREHAGEDASLIDLGCGVGNTLAYLAAQTQVTNFVAADVSENCLSKTREAVDCETVLGSVVDPAFAASRLRSYDFAVLSAVLHHLVGPTRAESRQNALAAIANALSMLREGGFLLIHEPVFEPRIAMDAVFWAKRVLSRLSGNRRVPVLGYWGNLGAPVVSYYSEQELLAMIARSGGAVERLWSQPESLDGPMDRLLDRGSVTVAARAG